MTRIKKSTSECMNLRQRLDWLLVTIYARRVPIHSGAGELASIYAAATGVPYTIYERRLRTKHLATDLYELHERGLVERDAVTVRQGGRTGRREEVRANCRRPRRSKSHYRAHHNATSMNRQAHLRARRDSHRAGPGLRVNVVNFAIEDTPSFAATRPVAKISYWLYPLLVWRSGSFKVASAPCNAAKIKKTSPDHFRRTPATPSSPTTGWGWCLSKRSRSPLSRTPLSSRALERSARATFTRTMKFVLTSRQAAKGFHAGGVQC